MIFAIKKNQLTATEFFIWNKICRKNAMYNIMYIEVSDWLVKAFWRFSNFLKIDKYENLPIEHKFYKKDFPDGIFIGCEIF